VLWEPQPTRISVLSPEEAWLMVSVMKDVVQRGTAAGSVGGQIRFPAGGKTGTTNDGTDVWFIGYTSDLVAGVWMGFDKPQKIKANAQGGILAAPAWTAFMTEAYKRKPAPRDWPMPGDMITRQIDNSTNMLATPYCPPTVVSNEFFIPGTDPVLPCDVHTGLLYPDTSGGRSLYPDSLRRPPRFPGDTSRRFRDSGLFSLPKRDTIKDTTRKRPPL
jgi:penicillin-binding protein 1A